MSRLCPGCRQPVDVAMYACRGCWYRLPGPYRRAITNAWNRHDLTAHGHAKDAAQRWLDRHKEN